MTIEALAEHQEGVVHRRQLRAIGLTDDAVRHGVASGRLHPKWPGVYAVGRACVSRRGEWMAAVMTCGPGAVLSHQSAAVLWGICPLESVAMEVSILRRRTVHRSGILIHRRKGLRPHEVTRRGRVPVTEPGLTLIDLAARFDSEPLEAAVNKAVGLRLITLGQLRATLDAYPSQAGVGRMRRLIDARTFQLTDSVLERLFIPIALRAGLPRPLTQQRMDGYRVDFHWPDLGLVVETDGGSFHRTASQQTRDRRRDQAHTAAGLTALRFTHEQVKHHPGHVEAVLTKVAMRLRA